MIYYRYSSGRIILDLGTIRVEPDDNALPMLEVQCQFARQAIEMFNELAFLASKKAELEAKSERLRNATVPKSAMIIE